MSSLNNKQLYDYIREKLKKEFSENYVTSYPKDGKTIYVAGRYVEVKHEAESLSDLKDIVDKEIK